jgi:hypothetical protein
MSEPVTAIVFYGDHAGSAPERLMQGAWAACARDTIDLALACALVDRVIVSTNSESFAEALPGMPRVTVERDQDGESFHFGRVLQSLIEKHHVRRPLYFGAASAPLLSAQTLESVCRRVSEAESLVIANGFSADFFAFTPVSALGRIRLPDSQDNAIPRLLSRQAGLELEILPRSVESSFDVDTPTDVFVLGAQSRIKQHARRYVESLPNDRSHIERAMPLLVARDTRKTLIGRVNTELWGSPELGIRGPRRLFVEERLLKAYGRELRGEVRTLLGDLYQAIGARAFFAKLEEYSDVLLFDSRPLLYHLVPEICPADRFNSDLGDVDAIQNPIAREFTTAVLACEIPVLLGGHSIVSGALWALVQEAWDRLDAGLLTPIRDGTD